MFLIIFLLSYLSVTSYGERVSSSLNITCWQCDNKQLCIPRLKLCDGIPDCPDSSDESANCGKLVQHCPYTSFMCDYGACIRQSARCDGVFDCADGSDERNCVELSEIEKEETEIVKCEPTMKELCDGWKHCADGSDEDPDLCSRRPACHTSAYRCDYGACVHGNARCNGLQDCADGSDEKDCNKQRRMECREPSKIPINSRYQIVQYKGFYWLLFKCDPGYSLLEDLNHMCVSGEWYPALPRYTTNICESQKSSWFKMLKAALRIK